MCKESDGGKLRARKDRLASELVFVKLGGSIITDKRRPGTARLEVIARLAEELAQALASGFTGRMLLGHGSGSFGHWVARQYGTREGVHTPTEWRGYAEVAAAASELNSLVAEALRTAGLRVTSVRPSASARCIDGRLTSLDTRLIHTSLDQGALALIYGDVALDAIRGGTIVSTEDLFVFLADELEPKRILLVGDVPGVLSSDGAVIPRITPDTIEGVLPMLSGAAGVDVTGGMADKVSRMIDLVSRHRRLEVRVFSGAVPGHLRESLRDPDFSPGTCITSV